MTAGLDAAASGADAAVAVAEEDAGGVAAGGCWGVGVECAVVAVGAHVGAEVAHLASVYSGWTVAALE